MSFVIDDFEEFEQASVIKNFIEKGGRAAQAEFEADHPDTVNLEEWV